MSDGDVQFYNRQGEPIADSEVRELLRVDGYSTLGRTSIMDAADPKRSCVVSTIWHGADLGFGEYPQPMIFQTLVFMDGKSSDEIVNATSDKAERTHQVMVEQYSKRMVDPIVVDQLADE